MVVNTVTGFLKLPVSWALLESSDHSAFPEVIFWEVYFNSNFKLISHALTPPFKFVL
jgi:hypothetical protein